MSKEENVVSQKTASAARKPPSKARARAGLGPLDIEQLRSLVEMFKASGVADFELKSDELRMRITFKGAGPRKEIVSYPSHISHSLPASPIAYEAAMAAPAYAETPAPAREPEPEAKPGVIVSSPMVGTFYRSPSPDAPPFVEVGSRVNVNTVLCIVEAMKIMNEIKAETSGVVDEILVENGQPVEFGQPMFRIVP
ncbi:MAG: Biotin carboxyl carrier protein of acetyl-CoA carboxylase [candidate division BRC1 bacterium ADurb.BinA364]|nr:MAG: Biotin carboxyl carrier protein of acetyl-CoA carboxylase [candidate division BRC1 bacterium ADurb.BinA364]